MEYVTVKSYDNKLVKFNKSLGIKTIIGPLEKDVLGYSLNDTIYLNEDADDLEKINKHELLHFFEMEDKFIELKNKILEDNKYKLETIRESYELRYMGLYSKDEIESGIIDTEIVIDILINNYAIDFSDGLKVGDMYLGYMKRKLEQKRYLNLSIKKTINTMNYSKWDKLFITNFYDGNNICFQVKKIEMSK